MKMYFILLLSIQKQIFDSQNSYFLRINCYKQIDKY